MNKSKKTDIALFTPISNSNRAHKFVQLENGIIALLVSDPGESLASFCITVATGSHNDPPSVPGLAHLCEHMVMSSGSKRFPNATHYHDLLSEYNGNQNAYTTGEQTSFYFEIPNSNNNSGKPILDSLVGVVADKIKAPIFQSVSINKEIYAIDNEHENNKNVTSKVIYHAIRKLANPRSQFHQFSTGNVHSLVNLPLSHKINLKDTVQKYFQEQFTADKMAIVIRSSQSLHYLQRMIQANFDDVKASKCAIDSQFEKLKHVWQPKYREPLFVDTKTAKNSICIQSSKSPLLRLIFPISHEESQFTSSEIKVFSKVWCDLFGDESPESIYQQFNSKNYLTGQVAQLSKFSVENDALVLQFNLTSLGWRSGINKVLTQFFYGFVQYLRGMDVDPLARYLNEWNAINILQFLYQDLENSTMDRSSELCSELLQCENPEFILNNGVTLSCNYTSSNIGSYYENEKSQKWWCLLAEKFRSFLSTYMSWDNCKIVMLGDLSTNELLKMKDSDQLNLDEYYDFHYYKGIVELQGCTYFVPFNLPTSEKFLFGLDRNLNHLKKSLLATQRKSQNSSLSIIAQSDLLQTRPKLVAKNAFFELWSKEEHSLHFQSRSILTVELINMNIKPSAEATMNLEILVQLLYFHINESLFPSERVGYMYQIAANNRGDVRLAITVAGFPQGLESLLRIIMDKLVEICQPGFCIPNNLFRKSRIIVRNKYEEASCANSCTLASLGVLLMLERELSTLEERLNALEEIDLISFQSFCADLWIPQTNYLNLVIQGDLSISDSVNSYLNLFTKHLEPIQNPAEGHSLCEPETLKLPAGSNLFIKLSSSKEDPTNSIVYFIETGDRLSPADFTMASLFEFFMSMTLVPDLRGKKQIGYVVLGGLRLLTDTLGLHISVMSNMDPDTLECKINEYLAYLENEVVDKMTEHEFNETVLQKYLQLIESNSLEKLIKNAGPANLMAQIEASVHSSNFPVGAQAQGYAIVQHRKLKDEISFRTYNFDNIKVDTALLQALQLKQFRAFFKTKISIHSVQRKKLSIMFETRMNRSDLDSSILASQLEAFLKLKGFHIPRTDLQHIVQRSKGRPTALFKDLFQHFRSQGQSLRLCTIVLKEIFKQIFIASAISSATLNPSTVSTPSLPLTEVHNVHSFKIHA